MPSGFQKVRFSVSDKDDDRSERSAIRGISPQGVTTVKVEDRSFTSDEAAARFYLGRVFGADTRPRVRGLAAPERAEAMPDLRLHSTQAVPSLRHRLLMFDQTQSSIPIFGSRVVVQLDENRKLVDIGGDVADFSGIPTVAALSPLDALKSIGTFTNIDVEKLGDVQPPELVFFHNDGTQEWHLCYLFKKVPAVPPALGKQDGDDARHGHGMGFSPRELRPLMNFLVDAHDGTVLFFYSAAPMVGIEPWSECHGEDELGVGITFWGKQIDNGFEMVDPRRFIKTFDMQGRDIDKDPVPQQPVRNGANNWQVSNRAAVSAHAHATKVYDFYKSVLLRDGIDDKGMDLISIVNCTYHKDQPPPEWRNAVWYDNKMWYGQDQSNGSLKSYSRFLDVIAHELTHGVTEYTSNLVYKNESGALNESFSDIFGIIIANWAKDPNASVAAWNWQLGAGLGPNGNPLRDLRDPTSTGDPAHMDDYLHTTSDSGGVHTNSNIHNKAAYNLFTATDAKGSPVFKPMEAAELYYVTLTRLSSLATFSDALQELVAVAGTFYAGDVTKRDERITHIKKAYANVGIT